MIHGAASRYRYHAPHAEAGAVAAAPPAQVDEGHQDARHVDALPVLRLAIAVALIFAFGALAPVIAAAAR